MVNVIATPVTWIWVYCCDILYVISCNASQSELIHALIVDIDGRLVGEAA
jgi:hypothetical protein